MKFKYEVSEDYNGIWLRHEEGNKIKGIFIHNRIPEEFAKKLVDFLNSCVETKDGK